MTDIGRCDVNMEAVAILREAQVSPSVEETRRLIGSAISVLQATISSPGATSPLPPGTQRRARGGGEHTVASPSPLRQEDQPQEASSCL